MLSMAFKVTNLTSEDLMLYSSYYNVYFYDDMGNLLSANDICIVNSCEYGNNTITQIQTQANSRTESLIPYGIPMNMNINIRGIRNGSKKLARGVFQMGFYRPENKGVKTGFDVEYFDIEYPEIVDATNPKKRVFGSKSIELLRVERNGEDAVARFRFKSKSIDPTTVAINPMSAFDNFGNHYEQRDFSIFDGNTKRNNYTRGPVLSANSEMDIEFVLPKVTATAKKMRRLTLNLMGYTFEWNDEAILGEGSVSQVPEITRVVNVSRPNYINYSDFETKVRNNENVVGKKIILENIYFDPGSDDILNTSHRQLDQLTQLLQSYTGLKVEVSGHTDNVGEDIPNMLLSQKRADSIKYYLIEKSINPSRITSVGEGKVEPISENSTEAGRKENRRVEIEVME